MWDKGDKINHKSYTISKKGQICNNLLSNILKKLASTPKYKTFLEIGTWNGYGSTMSFAKGFSERQDPDDYVFYSLECNKDKAMQAKQLYKNNKNIHILNEVIWNKIPEDFFEIFPECKTNKKFKEWTTTDISNMKQCNLFLERDNIPKIFDVLLLDGGEFTTYHEFQLLKNRCKVLILDDVNHQKCKLISEEIYSDDSWKVIMKNSERSGFLIAKKL